MSSFILPLSLTVGPARSFRIRARRHRAGRWLRPCCEPIEDRTLPSTVTWISATSGDWDNLANWSTDKLPTSSDTVSIPVSGITVTHSTGNDTVGSLDSKAAIVLSGGSLTVNAASTMESSLDVSGSATLNGPVSVQGSFTVDDDATLDGSATMTVAGLSTWGDSVSISVNSIDAQGGLDLNSDSFTVVTSTKLSLENTSQFTTTQGNQVSLFSNASITNNGSLSVTATGGSFDIVDADSSASFANQGTMTETGTTALNIRANAAINDGAISVGTGSLVFEDEQGGDASTGSFAGSGPMQLGGCSLSAASSIRSTGAVTLDNGLIVGGTYDVEAPGTTIIGGSAVQITGDLTGIGTALSVSDNDSVVLSPSSGITGATMSTLTVGAYASLTGNLSLTVTGAFTFSGGATLGVASVDAKGGLNYDVGSADSAIVGTQMTIEGNSQYGSGSGNNAIQLSSGASITNEGTLTVDVDVAGGFYGNDSTTSFVNLGTVKTSGATPAFTIATDTAINDGTIDDEGGLLDFEDGQGGDKSTGKFVGVDGTTLTLGGCTLPSGSDIETAGNVSLKSGVVVAGTYNVQGQGTGHGGTTIDGTSIQLTGKIESLGLFLSLAQGGSATLSPTAGLATATITTLSVASGASLGGTLGLAVTGAFSLTGATTIAISSINAQSGLTYTPGDGSSLSGTKLTLAGSSTLKSGAGGITLSSGASITNTGTITVDVESGDSYGISDADSTASFTNNGTITKTGAGSFSITTHVAINNGSLGVKGGTFTFEDVKGGDPSTGSFTGDTGTTLDVVGCALGAKSSIVSSGNVTLDGALVVAGMYKVTSPGATTVVGQVMLTGDVESLGANLSVSGQGTLGLAPSAGPGKLTVDKLNLAAGTSFSLGQTAGGSAGSPAPAAHHSGAFAQSDTTAFTIALAVATDIITAGNITLNDHTTLTAPSLQTTGNLALAGAMLEAPVIMDGGEIEGPGTIDDDLENTGDLVLGGGGPLTILGAFTQIAGAILDIAIGTAVTGSPTGELQVKGLATFAGTLTAHLVGGFTPRAGETYPIATFASSKGQFTPSLSVLGDEQLKLDYEPTSLTLVAPPHDTTTSLTASSTNVITGQGVTLTANVQALGTNAPTPDGTVSFMDGSTLLKSVTLTNGSAKFATGTLALGSHSFSAVYGGSQEDLLSTSPAATVYVTDAVSLNPMNPVVTDSVTATVSGPDVNGSTEFQYAWSDLRGGTEIPLVTDTLTASSDHINLGSSHGNVLKGDIIKCTVTSSSYAGPATVSVTIADSAPAATPGSTSVNEDGSTTANVSGTDPDNDTLTYKLVSNPAHGKLTLNADGSFTYTPTTSYSGSDSFTFTASDGTLESTAATESITVLPVNQRPTATPQTIPLLLTQDRLSILLKGSDLETPLDQLVYTIVSLPKGTLYSGGAPVHLGDTFKGVTQVNLIYLPPTLLNGALKTQFAFTVTDNGDPAGSGSNVLTSALATVAIQTPANSAGVLRIGGTLGNDTIALSQNTRTKALHVVINGAVAGSEIPFASFKSISVFGRGGNDTFTVAAGLPKPVTVQGGAGNDTLITQATNLTFNGGGGKDKATVTVTAARGSGTATLRPNSATLNGAGYTVSLNHVATIAINGGAQLTAQFYGSLGNDTFTAHPTSAVWTGNGFSNTVNGFGTINALASNTNAQAGLYDGNQPGTFSGSGNQGTLTIGSTRINVTQFGTVTIHGGPAKNTLRAGKTSYKLNKIGTWVSN